jgi:hypothetical protein
MSSDTSDERSEEGVDSNVLFGRMLFIYAKDGRVKCYSADEIRPIESEVKGDGWHHTATIDPARWIEAMANGSEDPSDILDEIQFKQNAEVIRSEP